MLKRQKDGQVAYEGYCIDLLNELAKTLHFTYHITPSPDGFFGVETINGSWNGMIGELLNKVRSKKKKQPLPDRGALEVPHFSLKLSLRMHTKRCMEISFFLLNTILK